ncbi:hypothetical protein LCGC14_2304680 [marine sediment metagenome]|uniref:TFIIB-type domain-containing protein n=1 Tax=marine sediment metagenome TaxID=412755 RepID=A0A0F9CMW7_9ZZZZ
MVKIKICAKAKKKKEIIEANDREYTELKEYMYLDICPKCGASPTYQKDNDRFVYCKTCGFTLDVEDFKISNKGKVKKVGAL